VTVVRSLVLTAARHGYQTAFDRKQLAVAAFKAGWMRSGPLDVGKLIARLDVAGTKAYGQSEQDSDQTVALLVGEAAKGRDGDDRGLSKGFRTSLDNHQLRVRLYYRGRETVLGSVPQLADDKDTSRALPDDEKAPSVEQADQADKLLDFAGDRDGQEAEVARHLSHFVNPQVAFGFVQMRGGLHAAMDNGKIATMQVKNPYSDVKIVLARDQFHVTQTTYLPFEEVQVGDQVPYEEPGMLVATMTYTLSPTDLAAGNGKYGTAKQVSYGYKMKGPGGQVRPIEVEERPAQNPHVMKVMRRASEGDARRLIFANQPDISDRIGSPAHGSGPRTRSASADSPPTSSSSSARGSRSVSAEASRRASRQQTPQPDGNTPARTPEVVDDGKNDDQ
jgi:hypothetical protein